MTDGELLRNRADWRALGQGVLRVKKPRAGSPSEAHLERKGHSHEKGAIGLELQIV